MPRMITERPRQASRKRPSRKTSRTRLTSWCSSPPGNFLHFWPCSCTNWVKVQRSALVIAVHMFADVYFVFVKSVLLLKLECSSLSELETLFSGVDIANDWPQPGTTWPWSTPRRRRRMSSLPKSTAPLKLPFALVRTCIETENAKGYFLFIRSRLS